MADGGETSGGQGAAINIVMKIYEILGFKSAETGMPSYDDLLKDPEYFARATRRKDRGNLKPTY
jgi:hypothetical protein